MSSLPEPAPASPRGLAALLVLYGVTAVHHVYGGLAFASPERLLMAGGFTLILAATLFFHWRGRRGRVGRSAYYAVAALFWVGLLGGYEGGYNHVYATLLVVLAGRTVENYPPDVFFQATGALTAVAAAALAAALLRPQRLAAGSGRLSPGAVLPPLTLTDLAGAPVSVPQSDRLTHLQFRRFAGCPVCDLHLRSFARRLPEVEAAGVREVIFFHSTAEELLLHAKDLPFVTIPDPQKRWYRLFGAEAGVRALLDPRGWPAIVQAVRQSLARMKEGAPAPSLTPPGGRWGLPADVLVDGEGRVVAVKYGEHVYDQWSVDDVLALSGAVHSATAGPARRLRAAATRAPAPGWPAESGRPK